MFSMRLSVDYIPGPPMPMTSWSTTASQKRVPVQVQEKLLYTVQQGNKCQSWVPASWFALTCHRVIHAKAKKPTQHAMSEFFLNDSLSGDVTNKGREFPTFKRSGGTTVTLPPYIPVSLSPCHTATLSPICLSQCLPVSRLSSPGSSLPSRLPSIPSSASWPPGWVILSLRGGMEVDRKQDGGRWCKGALRPCLRWNTF